jgi:hypothetical protein
MQFRKEQKYEEDEVFTKLKEQCIIDFNLFKKIGNKKYLCNLINRPKRNRFKSNENTKL